MGMMRCSNADGNASLTALVHCSGTLDVKEFSARFDGNSAAGDSTDTLRKRAAVLATAAQREGLQTPEELFSKFAGWSDLMSRKVRCTKLAPCSPGKVN